MAWTKEQLEAIEKEGTNIIVSAGAGSGKTAVLTERVLRKIKEGIHINELLIMTFTNAAAKEMKTRIRKKLKEANYLEEVNLIDSAYITTFDSFSLSIVKKYYYLLNLPKTVSITDESILNIEKSRIMDNLFDEYYLNNLDKFRNFIKDFCFKDDKELKKLLINLNDKLDMRIDREAYLSNYINKVFSETKINRDIDIYYKTIKEKIDYAKELVKDLSLGLDSKYMDKINLVLEKLFNSKNYDDVAISLDFRLPNLPANSGDEIKKIKEELSNVISEIKDLVIYDSSQNIKSEILSTKANLEIIVDIITKFNKRLNEEKLRRNIFSFNDISKMAIKIVENNKLVREELTNSFQEIMVDEYQDTNDIQEYFVSLISKNNVYMVGDIKQSIYRFRNANPYIFKNKYDLYSNSSDGEKIDLVKNFRSREEVLNNVNLVFDKLMDDTLGGANYKDEHQMVFGNTSYNEEGKTNQNYDFEILEYNTEDNKFNNAEKEAFIIADDIINKITNKYDVFDKDEKILRKITYDDFVILIDRTSDFDLYKKVFEYKGIPLTLYKDEELDSDYDILIIKNILKIEEAIDNEEYNEEFKYAFLSLGRSFLFDIDDRELFKTFINNSFKETDIYKKCLELYNYYYEKTPKVFFLKLLEIFNYEENLLKLNNISIGRVRLEYFYNLLDSFENDGKTISDFIEYLDLIFEDGNKAKFSINEENNNSVKIMTIHKSKGLEYHICYFPGFYKKFSSKELNDSILYSNKFGIIIPYFNGYKKDTIYKTFLKLDTKKEELSEKIRLLYVALTRAKEKMIIIVPKISEENISLDNSDYQKSKINSFLGMINYIYNDIRNYIKEVDVNLTKDYLINSEDIDYNNLRVNDDLEIEEINFEKKELEEAHYSKNSIKLITKEEKAKMEVGTNIHEKLELIDFKNPNYDLLNSFEKDKIKAFIESDLIKDNINSIFYKEYEFIYQEEGLIKHGIIDLMIESNDKIIIIDYKLKNIDDEAYQKQLFGYKDYIKSKTNKDIEVYLYSLMDKKYEKVV